MFIFEDNTVVTADTATCTLDGLYLPKPAGFVFDAHGDDVLQEMHPVVTSSVDPHGRALSVAQATPSPPSCTNKNYYLCIHDGVLCRSEGTNCNGLDNWEWEEDIYVEREWNNGRKEWVNYFFCCCFCNEA